MIGDVRIEDGEDRWPAILVKLQLEAKERGMDLAVQAVELDDFRIVRARYYMVRHGQTPPANGRDWHVHFTSRWGRDG